MCVHGVNNNHTDLNFTLALFIPLYLPFVLFFVFFTFFPGLAYSESQIILNFERCLVLQFFFLLWQIIEGKVSDCKVSDIDVTRHFQKPDGLKKNKMSRLLINFSVKFRISMTRYAIHWSLACCQYEC